MGLWALLACLLAVQSCSVSVSVRRASGPLLAHSLQHTTVKLTDRTKPLCSDYIIWQLLSTWLSTRPCWPTVPPPILGKRSVMSLFILCRKTLKMKRRISFSKQFLPSSIFALLLFSSGLGGLCVGECGGRICLRRQIPAWRVHWRGDWHKNSKVDLFRQIMTKTILEWKYNIFVTIHFSYQINHTDFSCT